MANRPGRSSQSVAVASGTRRAYVPFMMGEQAGVVGTGWRHGIQSVERYAYPAECAASPPAFEVRAEPGAAGTNSFSPYHKRPARTGRLFLHRRPRMAHNLFWSLKSASNDDSGTLVAASGKVERL
jgi:hypothetical protein